MNNDICAKESLVKILKSKQIYFPNISNESVYKSSCNSDECLAHINKLLSNEKYEECADYIQKNNVPFTIDNEINIHE